MFVFSVCCHVSKLKMFPHVTVLTIIIIWTFSISNMESADRNINTAAGDRWVDRSYHTIILVQTQWEADLLLQTINIWRDSLVVPVRGKHTLGASWSIKEPSYCVSDWLCCLLDCSIKQFPGARLDHTTHRPQQRAATTINIVTIISCDTGTNTILSWEH